MGDRTAYTLRIPAAGLTPEIIDGLENALTDGGSADVREVDDDVVTLSVYARNMGYLDDVVSQTRALLTERDLDRPFTVWQDPAYEWLGIVVRHDPAQPEDYEGDCDAQGEVHVPASTIAHLLGENDGDGLRAALRAAAGLDHGDALTSATA